MALRKTINQSQAEEIAVKALGLLASDPERLARFLALTGLGPETIRGAAASPGFLGAVLDYVAADEALLMAMVNEMDERPEIVIQARDLLAPPAAGD
ncbi:MAG TPA: DUF3572 domain-containing protein [Beijerinckiaceae bacterium]|nr:DUF3572 domain-containing protein [Beijerinckiaceae bacterium]